MADNVLGLAGDSWADGTAGGCCRPDAGLKNENVLEETFISQDHIIRRSLIKINADHQIQYFL